jgi:hypothetical protein
MDDGGMYKYAVMDKNKMDDIFSNELVTIKEDETDADFIIRVIDKHKEIDKIYRD